MADFDVTRYPEIARAGGLAQALTEAQQRLGIDLGPIEAPAGWLVRTGRGGVELCGDRRGFSVTLGGQGFLAAEGVTGDLDEAVRALDVWNAGITLRELAERFPFLSYDGLAEAYENGTQVEYRWNQLLTDPDLAEYRDAYAAVHDHPALGQLSPHVSHRYMLRLTMPPDQEIMLSFLPDEIRIEPSWQDRPRRAANVAEAIAVAAELLAEGQRIRS